MARGKRSGLHRSSLAKYARHCLASMERGERTELHYVCKRLGIPFQVEERLQRVVNDLYVFQEVTFPASNKTQRVEELRQVANLAFQLTQAIKGLTFEDRRALENEYFTRPGDPPGCEIVTDGVMLPRDPRYLPVEPRYFALPSKVIPDIENAAKNVCAKIEGAGKAGRPKVIDRYADFIKHIAMTLKPTNIAIGRGNTFKDVCCAVFSDAGLTLSDKAMEYFNINILLKLRAEGRCL